MGGVAYGKPTSGPLVHPEHDAIAAEVCRWYTAPVPELGRDVTRQWYGYHGDLSPTRARAVLRLNDPEQVPEAVSAARAAAGTRDLTIWVDDRARAARLDAALRRSGCEPGEATTHLALVGRLTAGKGPEDLRIEPVGAAGLPEWARVKLQCFAEAEAESAAGAGDETDPQPELLAAEIESRRAELPITDYRLGRLAGEAVAVLAYYPGPDQMVFNLGTRLPFRHRGIAQAMLAAWADAPAAQHCRSLLINAVDGGRPAHLYRRLGFVDEVYWYRRYEPVRWDR